MSDPSSYSDTQHLVLVLVRDFDDHYQSKYCQQTAGSGCGILDLLAQLYSDVPKITMAASVLWTIFCLCLLIKTSKGKDLSPESIDAVGKIVPHA